MHNVPCVSFICSSPFVDMVDKVDLHYNAINENKQLQLALRHVLQAGKLPQDIRSIMEYVRLIIC